MKKIVTIEKVVYICDRCGEEFHNNYPLLPCVVCGEPVCSICGSRYEFHFRLWYKGYGRRYYFDAGILSEAMKPIDIETTNIERYLCPDCVPKMEQKLQELGFHLID